MNEVFHCWKTSKIINIMKILILCTGNSCRSQMAEGILKNLDSHLEVFSAGTNPEKEVNPIAVEVMKEIGIDISHHKSKNVDKYLNESFDYVITVCDSAKETCPNFIGKVNNTLHYSFEDPALAQGDKETVIKSYRNVRDQIKRVFSELYLDKFRST